MTQATQAPPGPAPAPAQQQVIVRPFKIGVQDVDDEPYDVTVTLTNGTQTLTPQYEIPSTGFLNGVYILVENTVTASTATATSTSTGVGVLTENGPYNIIDNILFTDTNNGEIIGPVDGWDLYTISKWGGYCFQDDPEANTDLFAATANATASSSASGSFKFMLRIPVELVPRDALGSLPNKSSSTPFKIKTTVAAISTVFANSATVAGSCRFRMFPDSYWEPTATDGSGNPIAGNPPAVNTTQYWNKTPYSVNGGAQMSELLTNSVGFPVRNLVFALSAATGGRVTGEANFPDNWKLQLQSNLIMDRPKAYWKRKITEAYGYLGAGDTAGLKDNGVYVKPFCDDFYPKPGWENRRKYLRTTDGMRLQMKGTLGGSGAHTLTVYTNYVGMGQGSSLAAVTT
jgi:hypothetical protein